MLPAGWKLAASRMLEAYLKPGDGVIDLGAHVGKYTEAYAKAVGKFGHVLAVEPDPVSFEKLRHTVGGYPQVECVNVAVSDVNSDHAFYVDGADRRRSSFWASNCIADGPLFLVSGEPLDALARTVPNLRAIKMDVQGAECHVLDGGQETLARDGITWAVEFWPQGLKNAGRSVDELAAQFQAHGYEPIGKHADPWDKFLSLVRDSTGHQSRDLILRKKAL